MRHPIEIHRATFVDDANGDPQPNDFALSSTLLGLFAPSNPSEGLQVGRNTVISGGTVYVRTSIKPDVLNSDRAKIAGIMYEIDGDIMHWDGTEGYRGLQFAVKTVKSAKLVS